MDSTGVVIAFWVLSAVTVGSALAVFLSRNLMHAVVFLILAFVGNAGLFLTLSADFIAVAQVLIYAGAISVLLVFAVMLTPLSSRDNGNSLYVVPGVLAGLGIAAVIVFVSVDVDWSLIAPDLGRVVDWSNVELTGDALAARSFEDTIERIGDLLLGRYVLAFEVASVLLLFALLGAITLVQEDPDSPAPEPGATPEETV